MEAVEYFISQNLVHSGSHYGLFILERQKILCHSQDELAGSHIAARARSSIVYQVNARAHILDANTCFEGVMSTEYCDNNTHFLYTHK